ncbi:exo-alpha-sialidase [Rhodocytophaga rosea]|uniref:Exo-alpha-sialidase n=1 Tax=Rhodocytophaga rosea TaxID=2704465 RepID=A0A6C0GTN1_9BACT|nr:sialidase family protein [Rhodocytophaga rosea]QHT71376.1 exo-alpha-sialidase [Rhodocytophaga rosea]
MRIKTYYLAVLSLFILSAYVIRENNTAISIAPAGKQPSIAISQKGEMKIVYGKNDSLYYTSSADGNSFSAPAGIAHLKGLGLGMSRGPQIAITKDFTVVAAASGAGNIYAYQLNHQTKQWSKAIQINDVDTLAKEAFVSIAAGEDNQVYAVWLDLRSDRQNKIFGSVSADGGKTWSANKLIYQSPEGKGSVCECCKPSVTASGKQVHIMFRNSIKGTRDLYVISSMDGGRTFGQAQKLGNDTWVLKACPMDGGDLAVNAKGKVLTVWRRKNEIFMAEPGKAEQRISEGKTPVVSRTASGDVVAWHNKGQILVKSTRQDQAQVLGNGTHPKLIPIPGKNAVFCVWENETGVMGQRVDL